MDIETMIDIYKDDVYKLCLKLTNNKIDADDLFQDTWLKLYSNFHKLNDQKTYKNWIYTICINTYKDSYSKKKRWLNIITDFFDSKVQHEVMEHQSSTIDETEFIIFNTIEKKTIQNLIKDLDEKYKLPIILYYYLDYSYVDIASILNIPIGTLKYRLNQGKKLLKTKLENI
ncbi:RNA polymerase sigma factor [Alkaliphilus oremlandii]|uniref:RNA polymerase, sigma-24 subunit, ECF subfamily n=1 Tax=Alkaliphilus oremlandii (strain OhILAs) TaxID=350688 RepID=A8MKG5_ALKOO|nr:RNA polymerase sigma factor [Alkaliphilus oremlandii]ABW20297.1 RNA polymerase, sigma-24 subunit, ECF subfamily [Alkaliphilus oremlandii OhILAs]